VDRRETFSSDADRNTYLGLLQQNLDDSGVRLLGWCLMTNHVHLIALPRHENSLSVLLRRVHGRYAQYYNAGAGRVGHLWQNRFFACILAPDHLWSALAYVERNPVRAGMVGRARDYPWSSALAHITAQDDKGLLDMEWWQREAHADWEGFLQSRPHLPDDQLRAATYAGKPFGNEEFLRDMAEQFDRHWTRGRPKRKRAVPTELGSAAQFSLFEKQS
jgi:putative transposase